MSTICEIKDSKLTSQCFCIVEIQLPLFIFSETRGQKLQHICEGIQRDVDIEG